MDYKDEDIDKVIKESMNNIQIPKSIFEEAYSLLEDKSSKNYIKNILYIAAVLIVIVLLVVGIISVNSAKDKNIPIVEGNNNIESELPTASYTINELGDSYQPIINHLTSPVDLSLVEEEAQFVGVVKVEKITGYTNYLKEQKKYFSTPFIQSKVTIEKVYKGNLSGEIEMSSYGGVISVSDYEKALTNRQNIDSRFKDYTDEEKENTYIRVINSITISTIEPEVGKYYLVFMNYNNDLESYQVLDDLIYEYDIENDKTKNTETNEWEEYEFGKNK